MKLIRFEIDGYRRFADHSSILLDSKVVAIIGPNEAGKSSILNAMKHLSHNQPFESQGSEMELTRERPYADDKKIIEARFLLEDDDIATINHLEGGSGVKWYIIEKEVSGKKQTSILPQLSRTKKKRKSLSKSTAMALARAKMAAILDDPNHETLRKELSSLPALLDTNAETLPDKLIDQLKSLLAKLNESIPENAPKYVEELANELAQLIEYEDSVHPTIQAAELLSKCCPQILFFSQEDRELNAEYGLEEIKDPPQALKNLADLAGMDLNQLASALEQRDRGIIATIEQNANDALSRNFGESWGQEPITVRLSFGDAHLAILIDDVDTALRYSSIATRSDGMRQFTALLAFVNTKVFNTKPILLIDEAEMHLHYDAQADLIQMLTKQKVAAKVILTTHSIGCLPEDLGRGVRLVQQIESTRRSIIQNSFWIGGSPGYSPLLVGMGASTLAFIPVRNVLFAEGISDFILLPTLLREAVETEVLNFQIVPGTAEIGANNAALLRNESPNTAFVVDSDKGGAKIAAILKRAKIPQNCIFPISGKPQSGLVLEDFIDPEAYCLAFNEELQRSNQDLHAITTRDLFEINRPASVAKWCKTRNIKEPNKSAIAYRLLEVASEKPIVLKKHKAKLIDLNSKVSGLLSGNGAKTGP